jgi:hypothetical protein
MRLRLPEILDNRHREIGKDVSPKHGPPLHPRYYVVLISVRGRVDPRATVRPEALCPVTSWGIESATFRLVAQ